MSTDDDWLDVETIQRWRCFEASSRAADDDAPAQALREAEGERSARRLFKRYRPRLIAYFRRDHSQLAEDLAQETLYRAVRNICTIDRPPFEAWLFKVAQNLKYSAWRRAARRREHELPPAEDESRRPDPSFDPHLVGELEIEELIAAMPRRRQQCVRLRLAGYKLKDIATLLKISEGTVKTHLHHARRTIDDY